MQRANHRRLYPSCLKPCRSQSPEEACPLLFPVSWHSPCDGAGVVETMLKLLSSDWDWDLGLGTWDLGIE